MMTVDYDDDGDGMNAEGERENEKVVVHAQRWRISCEVARLRQKVHVTSFPKRWLAKWRKQKQ